MDNVLFAFDRYIQFGHPSLGIEPGTLDIAPVAKQLQNTKRFLGHELEGVQPLTVLQHSLYVSKLCPPEYKLAGLLHDVEEAVIGDIPSPVKVLLKAKGADLSPLVEVRRGLLIALLGVEEGTALYEQTRSSIVAWCDLVAMGVEWVGKTGYQNEHEESFVDTFDRIRKGLPVP